jgi:hypothetical protein
VEASRATDERAATLIEAKEAVGGSGDADARALPEDDGPAGFGRAPAQAADGTEPKRAGSAEIRGIEGAVDAQSGGEASRAAREVEQAGSFTLPLHLRDTLKGLERADQDAAADSDRFRADVEHEVIAIAEIDVGVASAEKHGAIARGGAAKVVSGRIALWVGFCFHDTAAKPGAGEFADDNFADEKAGQRDGVRRQLGAAEAPDGNGSFAGCHGWQARQSSEAVKKSNLTPD